MATQMQLEVILAGNRIATRVCKAEATKESIKTKPESGNCFCIRVFQSIELRLIAMSKLISKHSINTLNFLCIFYELLISSVQKYCLFMALVKSL